MNDVRLTIGITTRDRPEALQRCLRSIAVVAHLSPEVLVFDDASSTPVSDRIAAWDVPVPVRVLRDDRAPGVHRRSQSAGARGLGARRVADGRRCGIAAADGRSSVRCGCSTPTARLAAVAFAQCDRDRRQVGRKDAAGPSRVACYVAAFIGFAHLIRRDAFIAVGGYRESFEIYGEEKELCLRLIEAGYRTVYLPDALVDPPAGPGESQPATLPALRHEERLPHRAVQRAAQPARLAASRASRALLPHAPRVEHRRPVGVGVDSARAVEKRRVRVPRSKAGVI